MSFLDYPYNKSYKQAHNDVTPAALRSNREHLSKRLEAIEAEAAEIRLALKAINIKLDTSLDY